MKISLIPSSFTLTVAIFLSFCAPISIAFAQTYKCTKNGSTTYSQLPCSDGASIPANTPSGSIPNADYQEGLKRNKKDALALKKLEGMRQKDEAKQEKEMKAVASKNEKAAQKCLGLKTNEKWAKEDIANAAPKAEKKARLKYKRAAEKTALYCKTLIQ